MAPRASARLALLKISHNLDHERTTTIKQWHINQAISDAKPVATLNIAITAQGSIVTQGVCIEEEHAQAMLQELAAITRRIKTQIRHQRPALSLVRRA